MKGYIQMEIGQEVMRAIVQAYLDNTMLNPNVRVKVANVEQAVDTFVIALDKDEQGN